MQLFGSILYGQIISIMLSFTNISVSFLNDAGLYPFLFTNQLMYNLLLILSLIRIKYVAGFYTWQLKQRNWKLLAQYIMMGLADVGANISLLKSFESTGSLTVVAIGKTNFCTLLTCRYLGSTASIFAMFLSMIFFRRKYALTHFIGTCIVTIGIVLLTFSKFRENTLSNDQTFAFLGTILAFTASFCYALSSVIQEMALKSESQSHYPNATLTAMGYQLEIAYSSSFLVFYQV